MLMIRQIINDLRLGNISSCVGFEVLAAVKVDFVLLGCDAVWTCGQIPTFRRNMLCPSSAPRTSPHGISIPRNVIDISYWSL
jgi:hypothetical protein